MPARRRHVLSTLLVAVTALAGCGEDGDADASAATSAAPAEQASARTTDFTTAPALLDHLRTRTTAEEALALFDIVYTRTMAERVLVDLLADRERARLELHAALRTAFPDDVEPVEDLGMGWLASRLAGASIDRTEGRRAFADYADEDAGPLSVVLVRYRDTWWIAPETFSGGPAIDDQWFVTRQRILNGAPLVYARIAAEVRDGTHASAADALGALDEALGGRVPEFGAIGLRR